jgi:methionine-gamma-lyase
VALSDHHLATFSVHAGNAPDPGTGAIRGPVVMANSYLLPDDPSKLSWSGTDTELNTRNGGADQHRLEANLGGGDAAAVRR